MRSQITTYFKKIVILMSIFVILASFIMPKYIYAASSKVKLKENEFYFSGTTGSSYMISNFGASWIVEKIKDAVDYLLGMQINVAKGIVVGYAILIEEMITLVLESSTGIPMKIEDNMNEISTDGVIKTSNNVTVEAIIYNRVPILNINLFKKEVYKCVTGTGQYIVECEACYIEQLKEEGKEIPTNNRTKRFCKMEECKCVNCFQVLADEGYYNVDDVGNVIIDADGYPERKINAVDVIKTNISQFYYIMRLISIIGMLLILIVLGIKAAITSIASEKALYKKMIVDWLVGFILIFTIHYIMIFIINFNELTVEAISQSEADVTNLMRKEFYFESIDNKELEFNLYQAVRTLTYDNRLSIGAIGTIMYVTLVFMTLKYFIIYLKRYLTIIILTLAAPIIAFSFAMQKVLNGKNTSFKGWLEEYALIVFIQSVHALVYTIFIPISLIFALESPLGVVVSLVFLSFMSNAEEIFRKIFKMSNEANELAMQAPQKARDIAGNIKNRFAAGGNFIKNTPVKDAIKEPVNILKTEAFLAAVNKYDEENNNDSENDIIINSTINNKPIEKNSEEYGKIGDILFGISNIRKRIDPKNLHTKPFLDCLKNYACNKPFGNLEKNAIEKEIIDLENLSIQNNNSKQDINQLLEYRNKLNNCFGNNKTSADSMAELLDKNKYYDYDEKKGKFVRKYGVFGKIEYDRKQNKWVRHTMSKLIEKELISKNIFGYSDVKKLSKDVSSFGKNMLLGMSSAFVGLGTVVTNPSMGFGLLSTSGRCFLNSAKKLYIMNPKKYTELSVFKGNNKKYSFSRFGKGAKSTIANSILENMDAEKDEIIVENVKRKHKKLYKNLKLKNSPILINMNFNNKHSFANMSNKFSVTNKNKKVNQVNNPIRIKNQINRESFEQFKDYKYEISKGEVINLIQDENTELQENYENAINLINLKLEPKELEKIKKETLENLNDKQLDEREEYLDELEKKLQESMIDYKKAIALKELEIEEDEDVLEKGEDTEENSEDPIVDYKKIIALKELELEIEEDEENLEKEEFKEIDTEENLEVLEIKKDESTETLKTKKQILEEIINDISQSDIMELQEVKDVVYSEEKVKKYLANSKEENLQEVILELLELEEDRDELQEKEIINNIELLFNQIEQKEIKKVINNIKKLKKIKKKAKILGLDFDLKNEIKRLLFRRKGNI